MAGGEMRRRENQLNGEWPDDIQAGDFWKITNLEGGATNLTGTCWAILIPMSYGYAHAKLVHHTVREHEDGMISIRPNDGSSNSILVTGHHGEQWHGYIEHGEFVTA
jgi:hypothetical protein